MQDLDESYAGMSTEIEQFMDTREEQTKVSKYIMDSIRTTIRVEGRQANKYHYTDAIVKCLDSYGKTKLHELLEYWRIRSSILTLQLSRVTHHMTDALRASIAQDIMTCIMYGDEAVRDMPVDWKNPSVDCSSQWTERRRALHPSGIKPVAMDALNQWQNLNEKELKYGFQHHVFNPDTPLI